MATEMSAPMTSTVTGSPRSDRYANRELLPDRQLIFHSPEVREQQLVAISSAAWQ
jgi:hypothetical protein